MLIRTRNSHDVDGPAVCMSGYLRGRRCVLFQFKTNKLLTCSCLPSNQPVCANCMPKMSEIHHMSRDHYADKKNTTQDIEISCRIAKGAVTRRILVQKVLPIEPSVL
ncbi:hypothetical protein VNO77_17878 [Canavalia gladiata]|uniref:Uncharacterized protein n=1 Tax=Canavalia gladiata TaxID=3824 RepID=A0AAN9LNK8_CANGL